MTKKGEEKREIEMPKFNPAGFKPTHVPDIGLSSYKGYVQRPISSLFEEI